MLLLTSKYQHKKYGFYIKFVFYLKKNISFVILLHKIKFKNLKGIRIQMKEKITK